MDLSIIIPAYNEAERLPRTLERIQAFLKNWPGESEILVVDDGSSDGTAAVAEQAGVRCVRQSQNKGKGAAVRAGMLAASGEWRLLTDADLSTPIEDLQRLYERRGEGEAVIGSRRAAGAEVTVKQAAWKVLLGQMGNLVIRMMAVPGIQDTQCGFKLFRARTTDLWKKTRLNGWGYDFEILFLVRRANMRIVEVPVHWANDDRSRVKPSDYLKTLAELLTIRLNAWRGYYR